MSHYKTSPEDRALVAEAIKSSPFPLRVDGIAIRTGLEVGMVRKCISVLREAKKVYNTGESAQPTYAWSANRPKPAPRAERITNGSMTERLSIDPMHSLRPGAMDYQSIPSLVAGKRVPYRVAV